MKDTFDTEKEAQEALDKANKETLGFCPLIKSGCQKNCVCYENGYILAPDFKPSWKLEPPYCSNVLISGVIDVNTE